METRRAAGTTETLRAVGAEGLGWPLTVLGGLSGLPPDADGRADGCPAAGARLGRGGGPDVVRRCGAVEVDLACPTGGLVVALGGQDGRNSALCATARFTNSLEAADIRL